MRKISTLAATLAAALAGAVLSAPASGVAMATAPQASVSQLEQQLAQDQAKLAQLNNEVEVDNAALDALNRKLQADQQHQAELDQQLAQLARLEYQHPVFTLGTILGARSLEQLLSNLAQARVVADRQQRLVQEAARLRAQDQQARDQMAAKVAQVRAARDQAAQMATQVAAELSAAQRAGTAQSSGLVNRAQAVAAQARATATGVGSPPGPWPNHFAYGYCTWYVANHVYVPWYGNAIEWWANAQPYYPEGQTPRVGAIMVTRESSYGHVALVIAVNADGSWTVSEMNYQAWDVVDQRTIHPGQVPVVGFIYPPPQDER
jgi:surface antigen